MENYFEDKGETFQSNYYSDHVSASRLMQLCPNFDLISGKFFSLDPIITRFMRLDQA